MSSIQFFERIAKLLKKTIEKVNELDENDIIFQLDICSSTKTELIDKLKNTTFMKAEKQKFQTCMTHLT